MIVYTDKGAGLTERINRMGLYLRQENGVMMSNDDAATQVVIDAYTLADAQAYKCAEVDAYAKQLRDKVIKTYSAGEMASWPIKVAEAVKFLATGQVADAPMLAIEATARGTTMANLADRVSAKALAFAGLEATIAGVSGKHCDAIKACDTFEQVSAYDFNAGWPAV